MSEIEFAAVVIRDGNGDIASTKSFTESAKMFVDTFNQMNDEHQAEVVLKKGSSCE